MNKKKMGSSRIAKIKTKTEKISVVPDNDVVSLDMSKKSDDDFTKF